MTRPETSRKSEFVSGILLAAGSSARMGQPKLALPLDGKPLVQHALEAAAGALLAEILVVVAESPAPAWLEVVPIPAQPRIRVISNPESKAGQASSLRCGLAAVDPRAAAVAVLLGDQPRLTSGTIDRIVEAFAHAKTPAVRPLYSGSRGETVPGHPVVVGRKLWPEVETLHGDEGLRDLFSRKPETLTTIPISGPPPNDIDTREDYEREKGAHLVGT